MKNELKEEIETPKEFKHRDWFITIIPQNIDEIKDDIACSLIKGMSRKDFRDLSDKLEKDNPRNPNEPYKWRDELPVVITVIAKSEETLVKRARYIADWFDDNDKDLEGAYLNICTEVHKVIKKEFEKMGDEKYKIFAHYDSGQVLECYFKDDFPYPHAVYSMDLGRSIVEVKYIINKGSTIKRKYKIDYEAKGVVIKNE